MLFRSFHSDKANMRKYGVLIADDSALMRRVLKKIIEEDDRLYVAGTARDGEDAIIKAKELKPDVISLDINMPVLDGLSALAEIMAEEICPVVMVSSLTQKGAEATFEALELGAFDYVAKPEGTVSADMSLVAREIVRKLRGAAKSNLISTLAKRRQYKKEPVIKPNKTQKPAASRKRLIRTGSTLTHKAVAIGVSTGGPKILFEVLPNLPADLNAVVLVVQHMPETFTSSFAQRLDTYCQIPFLEAKAGMTLEPGKGYLARGGSHMVLYKKGNREIVIRNTTRPAHQFLPSVDVMMNSVCEIYGKRTVGVLMTGMGNDGAEGMVNIKNAGGFTIAESEESAIVFGMPHEAIKRGGASIVVPYWRIAEKIVQSVKDL